METFQIAPAGMRPLWVIVPAAIVLVVAILLAVFATRPTQIEVSPEGLRLRQTLYGRFIPADRIQWSGARRVDLSASPELAPARRTNGAGLPGYQAGWFRLKNGEKALVFLTDRSRTVYIPTSEGFSLLLSPQDPDRFLSAVRASQR
jgi:hypothetical protein